MINKFVFASVLSTFALTGLVNAQVTGSGTLGVTGTIQGSILVTFTTATSGLAVTGTGTSAASLPFGTVQMYGGTPTTGLTRSLNNGITSYDMSTPINIEVDTANTGSATYLLSASLGTADSFHTWTFNSVALSTTPITVDLTGTYGQANPYPFVLTIPTASHGASNTVSNTIAFVATVN